MLSRGLAPRHHGHHVSPALTMAVSQNRPLVTGSHGHLRAAYLLACDRGDTSPIPPPPSVTRSASPTVYSGLKGNKHSCVEVSASLTECLTGRCRSVRIVILSEKLLKSQHEFPKCSTRADVCTLCLCFQGVLKTQIPILTFQGGPAGAAQAFLCKDGDPKSPRYVGPIPA